MTQQEKEIVLTFADSDMKLYTAANRMHYNRNTVKYHMGKIKQETGLEPRRFWDLVKLVQMAESEAM